MASSIGAFLQGGGFRFGVFIPDVTIEAVGQDALGITSFPVESGGTLTDHSFKLPVRLEMTAGWSDSSRGQLGPIANVYQRLLALQATRQPFSISTSRRLYRNMLMEALIDPIGPRTINSMQPRITFRELIISRTATTGSSGTASISAGQTDSPQSLSSTEERGAVQAQPVNFSGNASTAFGGYDPSLAIGPSVSAGSLGGLQVDGVGTFDTSGLGENTVTTDPSSLGGDPGLFGRYSPNAFANIQPFKV